MSLAKAALPSDPEELRAFAAALQAELYGKTLHIEKLKAQLAVLRRARFGRSSEKLDSQVEQLELTIGDLEEGEAENAARATATAGPSSPARPRERGACGRKPLPEHLPRETVTHPAACVCPSCGGTRLTRIGTDVTEVLEYVPSHFKVVRHERPKLSCRACETITEPPLPSLPIERGRPGPGLLAQVLVAKYCDHLPLYRQSAIYARSGVELERSTLADWVGRAAFLLQPLAEAIARHARAGAVLHADDTPVPVLEPGRGKTKAGRLWVLVRDERPWGSADPPAAVYRYSTDRKREQAEALLGSCRGFLHADGYAGFNALYAQDPNTGQARLIEVACWAHARRHLFDAHVETKSPLALEALERIARVFAIETEICGKPSEVRRAVRQERSIAELATLKRFFEATLGQISGKSTLAKAIRYALSRWAALTRFTADGRLEMTNNAAERAIRPLILGRKNWLFAGSDSGGERAALLYTLIESAKLNGVEPYAYLADILGRVADHLSSRIDELLPWNWRPAPPQAAA
jgi:transposase